MNIFSNMLEMILRILFILAILILSIIFATEMKKGEDKLTKAKFYPRFISAFVGMCFNLLDYVAKYAQIAKMDDFLKIICLVFVLLKLNELIKSGDPRYSIIEEGEKPFSTTIGMAFCIMIEYIFFIRSSIFDNYC